MEKRRQRQLFIFVVAEDQKINPIATVRINQTDLKAKSGLYAVYKCRNSYVMIPAFDILSYLKIVFLADPIKHVDE